MGVIPNFRRTQNSENSKIGKAFGPVMYQPLQLRICQDCNYNFAKITAKLIYLYAYIPSKHRLYASTQKYKKFLCTKMSFLLKKIYVFLSSIFLYTFPEMLKSILQLTCNFKVHHFNRIKRNIQICGQKLGLFILFNFDINIHTFFKIKCKCVTNTQ